MASFWLNAIEQRTDWIDKLNHPTFHDSLTVDESMKKPQASSSDCPVMKLKKVDSSNSLKALITSGDCNTKARFLCSLDLSKPTKVHNRPNFSCLQSAKSETKDDEKIDSRRKRDAISELAKKSKENQKSKISINFYLQLGSLVVIAIRIIKI